MHSASVIGENVPIWDIRDKFGETTDMLVRNMEQGRDLSAALGENTCVLMRGHGAAIAGQTVQKAVAAAVYLQVNARVLSTAMHMGDPMPLTSGKIQSHNSIMLSPLGADRM